MDSGLTHYLFNGTTGALIDTDSNGLPDVAEDAPPAPDSSDNYIVALSAYNSAGRPYRTIENLGRINETQYDDAGRTVRTIQNYDDGDVDETDTACDVTVDYEYGSGGRLVTMTAYNAKGSGNGVQGQATKYLYTSAINASWQTAAVYPDSDDVLSQNETTKVWTITTDNGDHVSTAYDRLRRTTSTTDQRGVQHSYVYDSFGRLAHDRVTALGSSGIVDDAILRREKVSGTVSGIMVPDTFSLPTFSLPDPDGPGPLSSPVWEYGYDATTSLLTSQTDPDDNTTEYAYDFARTLQTVTHPDDTTDTLQAVQGRKRG